jgi:hypothetical protein
MGTIDVKILQFLLTVEPSPFVFPADDFEYDYQIHLSALTGKRQAISSMEAV